MGRDDETCKKASIHHRCGVMSGDAASDILTATNSPVIARSISRYAGLQKIVVNLMRLSPGERSSWPHAEEKEEEFVYVLEGEVDVWIDGVLHTMRPGDLAAFPAGTGICHCFINNSEQDVLLLEGETLQGPTIASTTRSILNVAMTCLGANGGRMYRSAGWDRMMGCLTRFEGAL